MSNRLIGLEIKNYRSLANVQVETNDLNVLFGPNGAGKSTFLDALWFVRDCAIRSVDLASSERSHGIGALWDGADTGANISIKIETELAEYEVLFGYASGRIEPFVGEMFQAKAKDSFPGKQLIERKIGSDKAKFYRVSTDETEIVLLREPERLALIKYLDLWGIHHRALAGMDELFRFMYFYNSRDADLYRLKKRGSESSHHTDLREGGQNLWSVIRNLHDRRVIDDRYDTIRGFMRESFPSFEELLIEPTGPNSVYGNFIEKERRQPIPASGVSDGHLQMLIHLTALFSEGRDRDSLILFDEPEISLHPHALAVFARAVKVAAKEWNKQIFIATHSPVLISQFDPENILAAELDETGQTVVKRVSEMDEIKDLLAEYATGSLYMAEVIAAQSKSLSTEKL